MVWKWIQKRSPIIPWQKYLVHTLAERQGQLCLQGHQVRFARLRCWSWLCSGGKRWGTPGTGGHFHSGGTAAGPGQPSPGLLTPESRPGWVPISSASIPCRKRKNLMCKVMDMRANITTYFSSRKYQLSSSSVVGEKYFASLTVPFSKENAAEFPVKRRI